MASPPCMKMSFSEEKIMAQTILVIGSVTGFGRLTVETVIDLLEDYVEEK